MSVEVKTEYTPEDLLTMEGEQYELVNGALEERHVGVLSDLIAGRLFVRLSPFCEAHQLGWVMIPSSGGFQSATRQVRKPDVAFVRYGRFPGEEPPTGHAHLLPDLAVEVAAPNDGYDEVEQKIEEYLRAGVRLVWVISPPNRTVRVLRVNGTSHTCREGDELDGEDVVPGFRCPVRELFLRPPPQAGNGAAGEVVRPPDRGC